MTGAELLDLWWKFTKEVVKAAAKLPFEDPKDKRMAPADLYDIMASMCEDKAAQR